MKYQICSFYLALSTCISAPLIMMPLYMYYPQVKRTQVYVCLWPNRLQEHNRKQPIVILSSPFPDVSSTYKGYLHVLRFWLNL